MTAQSRPATRPAMTKRTGGRILVDQLRIQGCDRIFTVPGESFLAVLDALHDTPEIDTIVCRQEGGVAYMADADGKMTGRPGVAFVTRGPGATNASGGRPRRLPGFDPDDPVHRRRRARRPRPRGLPGDRLPRLLRARSPNGRRGSRMRGESPNMSLAPSASRPPAGPARSCSRCPRTCCATRSRRSTAPASRRSPRSPIPARSRRCSSC